MGEKIRFRPYRGVTFERLLLRHLDGSLQALTLLVDRDGTAAQRQSFGGQEHRKANQ